MDKNIGKKLDGRYEITELIGVGGMAEVYKGIDVIDNKTIAIKILKKEYAENEEFLRRFRNESKAIAVLSHPNIVKIYDVGFSEKIQYIVMEYIDGITLKEYIEDEKILTWKDTVHFVIQILRALQHAHDKGIVHRDIKPQNIMMFTDGTIKVMDFGIAKFAREEGKTATDQAIGSVHYISPEQASGNVTDAKSDIYSVGAMMYEMLTGKKPFDSDNPVAIAVMHMHDIPERPRAVNLDIPDGLEEIVLRAMEKDPEDRYQTTAEMIADIEKFKADPSITFGYYQEEDTSSIEDTRNFVAPGNNEVQTETPEEVENAYASKIPAYAIGAGAQAAMADDQQYGNMSPQGGYDNYYEDEDDEEEEEERSSIVVPVLTAVVVVVIIVAVIFVASLLKGLLQGDGNKNDYTMPDLVGMDYNEAQSKYGNNIKFELESSEYNEADENTIIEQSIPADTPFNKGDILKVKISKGMATVEVPNLADMNKDIAQEQLRMRELKAEFKNSTDTKIQKNHVIKTEPEAGTQVNKGSTVIVYVSMGVDAGQVSVDKYVGLKAEDADAAAKYDGLTVKLESKHSYEKEGIVVEQSIEEKQIVEKDTEIILYISDGIPPEGECPIEFQFPDDASGRFMISFVLTGEDGNTVSQSSDDIFVPEMKSYKHVVKGQGEKVFVQILLTNRDTTQRAEIGTYYFDFAEGKVSKQSQNIRAAFEKVGGIIQEETTEPTTPEPTEPVTPEPTEPITPAPTEPTTPAPTEPTTPEPTEPITSAPTEEPIAGTNGEYRDGQFVFYEPGVNGEYVDNQWAWW